MSTSWPRVHGDGAWVSGYVGAGDGVTVRTHLVPEDAHWLDTLRALSPVDDATFVWAAGEASALVPLRRHLRRELNLPAEQVSVSGYWRAGVVAFDHHAPIDPTDPD